MNRFVIIFLLLAIHVSSAFGQSAEAYRSGKYLVDEFNEYSEVLMDSHTGYDLRPVYNGMADFILNKMKKQNLALVVHSLDMGMDRRPSVTYHLLDSIDSREPKLFAKLQIYFTGTLDPITSMYYIMGALFQNHGKSLKKVQVNRRSQINKPLKEILMTDFYDIYLLP